MLFGPIFSAEMVTTARRTRYFVIRVLYALVLLLTLWVIHDDNIRHGNLVTGQQIANLSADFFNAFAGLQLGIVTLLAPALAASAIAIERERRTIEYLFATDLRNGEIVLGKLTARLLGVLCQVFVGLPILAVAMLLGGISPQMLALVYTVTLSTMFCFSALGLAVSVTDRRARDAVTRVYLALTALVVLPMFARALPVGVARWVDPVADQLLAANPLYFLFRLWGVFGGLAPDEYWNVAWAFVWRQGLFAVICLVWAVCNVRRAHLRQSGAGDRAPRLRRFGWRGAIGDNPMLWKELHTRRAARFGVLGRVAAALLLLSVVGMATWQFVEALQIGQNYWRTPAYYYIVTIAGPLGTAVATLGLLLLAARAACSITSEKDKDTWLSLLATSLEPADVVNAKLLGNFYAQRYFLLLLLYVWGLTAFLDPGFLLAVPFLLGTYAALAFFVNALGLYISLRASNSLRALAATLSLVVFIGGGYLFTCCLPVLMGGPGGDEMMVILAGCMPFLLAAPAFVYSEWNGLRGPEGILIVTYFLGVLGYLVSGAGFRSACIHTFDETTGRTRRKADLRTPFINKQVQ